MDGSLVCSGAGCSKRKERTQAPALPLTERLASLEGHCQTQRVGVFVGCRAGELAASITELSNQTAAEVVVHGQAVTALVAGCVEVVLTVVQADGQRVDGVAEAKTPMRPVVQTVV